jgi:hypothetical protein
MEHIAQALLGASMMALAITQANEYRSGASPRWQLMTTPALGILAAWVAFNAVLSMLPVLDAMQAQQIVIRDSGRVDLLMHGHKVRACRWVATDGYVQSPDGKLHESAVTYPDDPSPGNTRPVGLQSFGWWSVQAPAGVQPAGVQFVVRHSCGWMWETSTTVIGPISLTTNLPAR